MLGESFPQTLEGAQAGAELAWASIYGELAPSVLGYFRGRGASDPDDLTGEVFLQVVRDLHTFAGDEREFRAWVFTIAHHRLIDARRRLDRRPVELSAELVRGIEPCDADDRLLRRAAIENVRWVLDQLRPEQRDVLLLRVFGDLTVDEVALLLGKSPGAVKALQRRGLEAVAGLLAALSVTL
jgi:RNA polymerase sigma-70 factor (ECF subfamily)